MAEKRFAFPALHIFLEKCVYILYNVLICMSAHKNAFFCHNKAEVIALTDKDKKTPEDKEQNESSRMQERLSLVEDTGSVTTDNGRHRIHCMTIVGQIEGHYTLPSESKTTKYEHVIPQLVAVDESRDIDGLLILLNTVGGDVEAGLALAELIAGMKKPTVSLVLGGGHSIGVPLAVAARRSFIVPSATMTIHPVRINGLVLGVPQAFTHFQRMQERIIDFVCRHSRMDAEQFMELCMNTGELATDIGTVLDGEEAVQVGLMDAIGTLNDAMEALHRMIDEG